jgi:glycosyltransferase involved in cell wall biosynthesis
MTHRFVAVSADIAKRLTRYEGIAAERIEVVYNGVSTAIPSTTESIRQRRAALGFGAEDIVIGTVGRLDPIKNLPMLIAALKKVSAGNSRIRGLIVGDGPQREAVAGQLYESGLSDRVVLTGHRDDARELLPCMDLFVLASFSEGTSVALLEAMSAGLPAAVTAVGGNPEIVVDGQTGWVVPSDDIDELASAFEQAVGDQEMRVARGEAGRARFASRFAFTAMIDAYRSMYQSMLSRQSKALPIMSAKPR